MSSMKEDVTALAFIMLSSEMIQHLLSKVTPALYIDLFKMSRYLIGKGADVNCISGQGYSPLHQAALSDAPEIVKYCLSYSSRSLLFVSRMLLSYGADVNCQDEEMLTALHMAARDGYGECVWLLCKAGADVFAR